MYIKIENKKEILLKYFTIFNLLLINYFTIN